METNHDAPAGRIHPHAVIRSLRYALRKTGELVDEQNAGGPRTEAWGGSNLETYEEAMAMADAYEKQEGTLTGPTG